MLTLLLPMMVMILVARFEQCWRGRGSNLQSHYFLARLRILLSRASIPVPEDRLIARGSLLVFKVKLGSGVEKFIGCIDSDGRVVHPKSDLKVCGSASTHAICKSQHQHRQNKARAD